MKPTIERWASTGNHELKRIEKIGDIKVRRNEMNIDQAIVFSILTQDIKNISSVYIEEKYYQCMKYPEPSFLLDAKNKEVMGKIYISLLDQSQEK
jgi:plasmid maintenance system killer protein